MKVSIVAKVRLGFSIAIFACLVIAEMLAASGINIRQRSGAVFCIGLALLGFVVWLVGVVQKEPPSPPAAKAPAEGASLDDPLRPFRSRRFWGVILMISAGVVAAASAYRYAPPPSQSKPPPPPPSIAAVPVIWPDLTLEAVIVHGPLSSPQINGQLLHLGEGIEGVRLVAVGPQHAVVEMAGQTNVLILRSTR